MKTRINLPQASPGAFKALLGVERYLGESGLEVSLLDLVKLRASLMNGCAYCIDMHWKDARARGESEQRLYGLGAWRESPYYSERERAALAWTEAVTNVVEGHVGDEAYATAAAQFDEKQLVDLTLAITAINSWNRLSIAFRSPAGTYQPRSGG
jgi:AhpD family alkylhydroperoxidase